MAERFLAEGAQVVAADLNDEALGATADRLPEAALTCVGVDVADETSVAELMAAAERQGPVDLLVNVAGIGSVTTAPETSVEVWDRVLAVNARGTFLCCKHAIPSMASRGRGAIVNIASVGALVGLRNRAAYCASKGAVVALTRAMALDHMADGIRVNCVCPGTIDSPWVKRLVEDAGESLDALRARQPMGRLGTPAEVADAVLYLAEDSAAFVTGSILTIDGGMTAQ